VGRIVEARNGAEAVVDVDVDAVEVEASPAIVLEENESDVAEEEEFRSRATSVKTFAPPPRGIR